MLLLVIGEKMNFDEIYRKFEESKRNAEIEYDRNGSSNDYKILARQTAKFAESALSLAPENQREKLLRANDFYRAAAGDDKIIIQTNPTLSQTSSSGTIGRKTKWDTKPPKGGLDTVVGMYEGREEIENKAEFVINNPEEAKKLGLMPSGGMLLYSLPGNGKTFFLGRLARYLQDQYQFKPFKGDGANTQGMYVGQSEKFIKQLHDEAKKLKRAFIGVDEANSHMTRRDFPNLHEYTMKRTEAWLDQMQGLEDQKTFDKILLYGMATNFPWLMDNAAIRPGRLDSLIYIPLPEGVTRVEMLRKLL